MSGTHGEYHQDVWKNVNFEFGAVFKPVIKLIDFHAFSKFKVCYTKKIRYEVKRSQDP